MNPALLGVVAGSRRRSGGILDAYSSGAVIAASIRKLFSTAVNSLQVKRSTDSATLDIGFIGQALDTALLNNFIGANTGRVPQYYNQVNAANPLISVFATAVPIISAGSYLNGPRSERNSTAFKSTLNASAATGFTAFLRIEPQTIGNGAVYHFLMQGAATGTFPQIDWSMGQESSGGSIDCRVMQDNSNRLGKSATGLSAGAAVLLTMKIVYGSPCVVTLWKDNVLQTTSQGTTSAGTANIAAMATSAYRFGCDLGSGNGADCTYRDIVVYETALSDADIGNINTILMS